MTAETSETTSTSLDTVEGIIAALDRPYDGLLAEAALRAAQNRRSEIVPGLIALLERETNAARAGETDFGEGALFALHLLAEFGAREALPAVIDAVSLPGELPFDLFSDAITESLGAMLAALTDVPPDRIDALIRNRRANEYVRSAASESYECLVRDERLPRLQAAERLRGHLEWAITQRDRDVVTSLVVTLSSLDPVASFDLIENAFQDNLVDTLMIQEEDVLKDVRRWNPETEKPLHANRLPTVSETVEEMKSWHCYSATARKEFLTPWKPSPPLQPPTRAAPQPTLSTAPRQPNLEAPQPTSRLKSLPAVGRNELCSCGSGKKFKKCCGAPR